MELLKVQFSRLLVRAGAGDSQIERLLEGLERKWVANISIYGLDQARRARCQLSLTVDWDRYSLHIQERRVEVEINNTWKDDMAAELDVALGSFHRYVREHDLSLKWYVTYTNDVDYEEARKHLGLVPAEPVRWTEGREGAEMTVPEIDELSVGFYLT